MAKYSKQSAVSKMVLFLTITTIISLNVNIAMTKNSTDNNNETQSVVHYQPRQRSDTRTYENSFPAGFLEGFLKIKTQGGGDCMSEGLTIARAYQKVLAAYLEGGTSDDQRNVMSLFANLQKKCNYGATFQGLIVTKLVS